MRTVHTWSAHEPWRCCMGSWRPPTPWRSMPCSALCGTSPSQVRQKAQLCRSLQASFPPKYPLRRLVSCVSTTACSKECSTLPRLHISFPFQMPLLSTSLLGLQVRSRVLNDFRRLSYNRERTAAACPRRPHRSHRDTRRVPARAHRLLAQLHPQVADVRLWYGKS